MGLHFITKPIVQHWEEINEGDTFYNDTTIFKMNLNEVTFIPPAARPLNTKLIDTLNASDLAIFEKYTA